MIPVYSVVFLLEKKGQLKNIAPPFNGHLSLVSSINWAQDFFFFFKCFF